VVFLEPVTLLHTNHAGHPKKTINIEFLTEAVSNSCQINLTELAKTLELHRNTLQLYMKGHGVAQKYSELTNSDLNILVGKFKKQSDSDIRYIISFLHRHGP